MSRSIQQSVRVVNEIRNTDTHGESLKRGEVMDTANAARRAIKRLGLSSTGYLTRKQRGLKS